MNTITIGHDSEFGLHRDGELISALEVFGEEVQTYPEGRIFADNLNVEIAIDPVTELEDFHRYTEALLGHLADQGFTLDVGPVVHYEPYHLAHPMAAISGCMPDFSAYTLEENVAPNFEADFTGDRTVGAHIHAQLDGARPDVFARWMDMLVTLPLLFIEEPSTRREMYGGPGCYRDKPYGGEYRTLSSFWVQDPDLREFIWNATHKAVQLTHTTDPESVDSWWDIPTAIQNHDRELARRCFDRLYIYGLEVL